MNAQKNESRQSINSNNEMLRFSKDVINPRESATEIMTKYHIEVCDTHVNEKRKEIGIISCTLFQSSFRLTLVG